MRRGNVALVGGLVGLGDEGWEEGVVSEVAVCLWF